MKIKKLTIKNFRGIDQLELDFTGPDDKPLDLVVLAGPNGCGKTSVLEACIMLLGRNELLPQHAKQGKINIKAGAQGFELAATLYSNGVESDATCKSLVESGNAWGLNIDESVNDIPVEYFSSWRAPKLVGSVSPLVRKKGRRPDDTVENRLLKLKQLIVNLLTLKGMAVTPEEILEMDAKFKNALDKINKVWKYLYPERDEKIQAARSGEDIEFDLFLVGRSEGRIPIDSLSSGELEALTMMGRFITNNYENGIVFIDEPELHLHQSWHRIILKAIKTMLPDTQVICSTHSPEILDSVYSYERFTLLDEDDPRAKMQGSIQSLGAA